MPLINKSVTIEFSFLLLIISAIVSSKTINILRSLSILYSSIVLWTYCVSFEYSMRAFGSSKWVNSVLSLLLIKNWYLASGGSLAYKYIYQYLAGCLSNVITHLLCQIQNLLLLILCMDDLEYTVTFDYAVFCLQLHNHQN